MKLSTVLWIALESLFLIVFNVLFFMFIDVANASTAVWVSYGFIHFAYLLLLLTPLFVRRGSASEIYSRPLYAITATYFVVELIVGLLIILNIHVQDLVAIDVSDKLQKLLDALQQVGLTFALKLPVTTTTSAVVVQTIIAALFLGALLIFLIVNLRTAENVERHETELKYVKNSAAQLLAIMRRVDDKAVERKIERVYDLINSSPARSDRAVSDLEQSVMNDIAGLEHAVRQGDGSKIDQSVDRIIELAEKRNQILRRI